MSHVINNISHYMMFEGLESRWAKFQAEVDEACDLDGIIEAHENFLADVLEFALLEERSQTIKVMMNIICMPENACMLVARENS